MTFSICDSIYELLTAKTGGDKCGAPKTSRSHLQYVILFFPIQLMSVIFLHY